MQAMFPRSLHIGRWPVAALLAGSTAVGSGIYLWPAGESPAPAAPVDLARQAHCVDHALLVHDVRWAAACMQLAQQGQGDGIADCDLPNAEAGRLYALLQEAEQHCTIDARRALGR